MIKRVLILLICIFCQYYFLHAQQISGYVYDNTDEKPIPYASVVVEETMQGTATDTNGFFILKLSQQKTATLIVSCVGYEETKIIYALGSPKNKPIIIHLIPKANFLNTIVITGTRMDKMLKNTPVLTKVISQNELHDIGAVTVVDALESLMPGIHFSPGAMGDNIQIQGLGNNYILVLVNGERLVGEQTENINFSRLNVADVKQIEIINGAASVLYGSSAIGAIINIITKDVNKPVDVYIQGRYSKFNTYTFDAGAGFKIKRFSSKTTFNTKGTDGYDLSPETPTYYTVNPNTDYSINQQFKYKFNEKLNAELNGTFYSHETFNPEGNIYTTHPLSYNYTAGGKINYLNSPKNAMTLSGYGDIYKGYKVYEKEENSKALSADYYYSTYRFIDAWKPSEKIQLVGGVESNVEKMYVAFLHNLPVEKNLSGYNNNLFTQIEYKLFKNIDINGGLRLTQHSEFGMHFSPKISGMYTLKDFRFRAGISNGFKAPTLREMYLSFDHGGMFNVVANPDLIPEESWYESVSIEYIKENINIAITVYNNNISDKITDISYWIDSTGKMEQHFENVANAHLNGIDASLQWRFLKYFYLRGSYGFSNAVDKATGLQLYGNSKHNGTLGLTFKRSGFRIPFTIITIEYPFSFNFSGRISSSRIDEEVSKDENGNEIIVNNSGDPYSLWRFVYSQKIPVRKQLTAEIQLGIDNVFDYANPKSNFMLINPGRTFFITAKLSF